MNIENRLKELIAKIADLKIDMSMIHGDTNLNKDLSFESIQMIQLIIEIENEFNIEIEDDDLIIENLTQFNNLLMMISRKVL